METTHPDYYEYYRIRRERALLKHNYEFNRMISCDVNSRLKFYELCHSLDCGPLINNHNCPNLIDKSHITLLTYMFHPHRFSGGLSDRIKEYIFLHSPARVMYDLVIIMTDCIMKYCDRSVSQYSLKNHIDWGEAIDNYTRFGDNFVEMLTSYTVSRNIHSIFFRYLPTAFYKHEGIELYQILINRKGRTQLRVYDYWMSKESFRTQIHDQWSNYKFSYIETKINKKIYEYFLLFIYKNIPHYNYYLLLLNEYRSRKLEQPNGIGKLPRDIIELIFSYVLDKED